MIQRKPRNSTSCWWLLGCFVLFWLNCGGGPKGPDSRAADELTAEGWLAFEAGDFAQALAKFDSAIQSDGSYVDAYNGAGWANARLGEHDTAAQRFAVALDLNGQLLEAHAGAALVYHALNLFHDAIAAASVVLDTEPAFVFAHDPAVDALDMRIILALSYYSVGDFDNAAAQMDIIDPAASPHSTNPETLIREIMHFFGHIG